MLSSEIPEKIPLPFADAGAKNPIPTASQIGITPGAASLNDGFPPLTMTPKAAGGLGPSGADMNGILNRITAIQQWQSAGGIFKYDAAFSTAIGGYPAGAILQSTDGMSQFLSLTDNNTDDPNAGTSVNWALVSSATIGKLQRFTANGSFTVPAGVTTIYLSGCAGGGGGAGAGGNSTTGPKIGSGGGGGGAGQPIIKEPYSVTPGAVITITIGAGGAGGVGANGADGTNGGTGGNTVIGTLVTLTGGGGGSKGVSLAASSSVPGPNGGTGYPKGGYAADATSGNSSGYGGVGASGPFGGGGSGGRGSTGTGVAGNPAYGYGAGGGGGGGCYSTASTNPGGNGGDGAPGIVIIEW